MASRGDDHVPRRPAGRSALLTGGLVLAVAAVLGAFLTADPRFLRLAVVAAAAGFAAAVVVAVRRQGEAQAVLAREDELRRAYERELDLEAAARREFELDLENDLRQRSEAAVHEELGYLRADISALDRVREELGRAAARNPAELTALRGELASLSALRDDVASLSALRADLSALASLRDDVAALGVLRADLGQLAELRADVSRLRAEIIEQLNSEMLVERIVMRTQATRKPADPPPTTTVAEAPSALDVGWSADPSSTRLTGGWSALRLDDPGPTREYERVRPVTTPAEPRTWTSPAGAEPAPSPLEWLADRSILDADDLSGARHSRHSAAAPDLARPTEAAPPPAAVTSEDALSPARPVPYRRRRTDETDGGPPTDPATATTAERRAPRPAPPFPTYDRAAPPALDRAPLDLGPETDGHARLAEILAESGGSPPSGRRRHRYREDDEPDDVLSRVLRDQ